MAPLSLRNLKPLARGSRRMIFQHPLEAGALIKVLKFEARSRHTEPGFSWFRYRRAKEMVQLHLREMNEYLRARSILTEGPLPIARILGLVETDRGMGLVVEKIAGPDGGLAPSLRTRVMERGFDRDLEQRILTLRDEVVRCGIVAGDINTYNVVAGAGSDGTERLVIVDGTGDKTFLPANSFFPFINRTSVRRQFAGVIANLQALNSGRL